MITSLGEEGAGRCDHFTRERRNWSLGSLHLGKKELVAVITSLEDEGAGRCDHFTRGRRSWSLSSLH